MRATNDDECAAAVENDFSNQVFQNSILWLKHVYSVLLKF